MGLRDFTVYDMISRNSVLYSGREALIYGNMRLTFEQFRQKCDIYAAGLTRAGIRYGDRIAIVAQNSDFFMILYGAAAKIGAITVPVNWRFQSEEIEYIFQDCTPKIVFAGSEFEKQVAKAARSAGSVEKLYAMSNDPATAPFQPFDKTDRAEGADDTFDIPSSAGYVIIYTAAVEGKPRGALLSQGNIIATNTQILAQDRYDDTACHLCILPLFHIAALSTSMAVMHGGAKNVILDRFEPALALRLIEKEKVTTFGSFAPILKMLIQEQKKMKCDLSSIRSIGGLEDPESIRIFSGMAPNVQFLSGFAQTEAIPVTSANAEEKPGSAGKPAVLARVALFDDNDQEVPVGREGEICVRSPSVFQGYWGLEKETAYTFRNGWHHTGDIGRFDEDGYLWYVKRKAQKELIKPGGENVYPAEVEKAILEHGDIAEASVIGVPDETWGEAIKAVCVLKKGKEITPDQLIHYVASKIARYKKPKYVVFVDSLPRTEEGEIDRAAVKKEHGGKY
ncbi:MAG: AMP-binding protein [Syntrophales bacterium]|jgi:long-chain acyl-CoA synthetase|nr:AMP-binding protein [Syntrophales bacterium]MDY0045496.1 AMP-binding protein [Syntrophales bacterium]